MSGPEKVPGLEVALARNYQGIFDSVNALIDSDKFLIDDEIETSMPGDLIVGVDCLHSLYGYDNENEMGKEDSWQAIYRGLHFGMVVSRALDPNAIVDNPFAYFKRIPADASQTEESTRAFIDADVDLYLKDRPDIRSLIRTYVLEIDPSKCKYNDVCGTVAGLAFMMADESVRDHEAIHAELQSLHDEGLSNQEYGDV